MPVTVTVVSEAPAIVKVGVIDEAMGGGLLIVNDAGVEDPPPGAGLLTTICVMPPLAISAAVTETCNCVPLTKVVVLWVPFQSTTDVLTNPVPTIVRADAFEFTTRAGGLKLETVGAGLFTGKFTAVDVPPPGVGELTDTWAVPPLARSCAENVARNCVALTNDVVRAAPFQSTVDVDTNPDPVTVIWTDEAPAVAELGEIDVTDGIGFNCVWLLLLLLEDDTPPPHAIHIINNSRFTLNKNALYKKGFTVRSRFTEWSTVNYIPELLDSKSDLLNAHQPTAFT